MSLKILHKQLINKKLTISVAESCTGGLLAHNLTKIANSSNYFKMGLITYSNEAKIKILKVNKNIIKKYGAVSKECCEAMVKNLSKISKSKINVSITGIAGPGGGTKDKPVGLVYIGIKMGKYLLILENKFRSKNRSSIQKATVREILKKIIKIIS
jgi:nicotinamide-nucleotide amidase